MEVWDLLVGMGIWVLLPYEDSRMWCLREPGSRCLAVGICAPVGGVSEFIS